MIMISLSFCAVIGPVDSETSQGTNFASYIADQQDMVQIIPLSFDVDPMDNPQFLHTFFRSSQWRCCQGI